MSRRKLYLGIVAALLTVAITAVLFACSETPTEVPVRTFERAQRMDVACMQLTEGQEPLGVPEGQCPPVPVDVDGTAFKDQLFALVTQTQRGELAVVNLSAGALVDQKRATPGVNFLPVGALPTDVVTTPDGKMAFVATAEANKPAIYGIPTRRILGDTDDRLQHDPSPVTIGSWPMCVLPQKPGALAIVPRSSAPGLDRDAGAADGGAADGGDAGAGAAPDYVLVVALPGDRLHSAKLVTIDPLPFRRGALRKDAQGNRMFGTDEAVGLTPGVNPTDTFEPGALNACPTISVVELAGNAAVPSSFTPGPKWDDGVKYVDGGTDLSCLRPASSAACGAPFCCAGVDAGGRAVDLEGGAPTSPPPASPGDDDAGDGDGGVDAAPPPTACQPVTAPDAGPLALDLGPLDPPRLVSMVRDEQLLYIADDGLPLIHVVDMTTPSAPRELPPLLATSVLEPSRVVGVKSIALSPPTREFKRFLYAIDETEGSVMVYDVTDPMTTQRTPLTRPHPELNPFQPPDRISFGSPIVSVAFARHDVPLSQRDQIQYPAAAAGVLCNPNEKADPATDLGFYYRADRSDPIQELLDGRRLRGIFGFATAVNGSVFLVDVDDWDSPCRRPVDMSGRSSDIAPAEPDVGAGPYEAPTLTSDPLAVTGEVTFPIAAPHTLRSSVLIRNDPATTGNNLPRIDGQPILTSNGETLSQIGTNAAALLDLRFATEVPQVQTDQDWTFTYEGPLPGFDGLSATVDTTDEFSSLTLGAPSAHFCAKGVEDWALGKERTAAIDRELIAKNVAPEPRSDRLMTDYVELTEDMLPPDDPYWTIKGDAKDPNNCWAGLPTDPFERQNVCVQTYGAASDQSPARDFPIIEAYDDKVVLGRFFTPTDPPGTPDPVQHAREVVYSDPSNGSSLKLMQCCFHKQVTFKVRTGHLWSAVAVAPGGVIGSGLGFFSHLTTDSAGRCVSSCDPRESLLNGRAPAVPGAVTSFERNSALGMRNPLFDVRIVNGNRASSIIRDATFTFSTQGGFQPLFVSIADNTSVFSVSPQSMQFIEPLGQMAVVDGVSQGLVLIDLQTVAVARAPYF